MLNPLKLAPKRTSVFATALWLASFLPPAPAPAQSTAPPARNAPAAPGRGPVFTELFGATPPAQPGTNAGPVGLAVPGTHRPGSVRTNLSAYVPDDKYKLRPGDKVSLQILEDREPAKPLLVADSGELDVPYLGRVLAADKTCKTLAAELKGLLEKEYYYRATVVLALDSANKLLGRVYVWGQVRNQGPLDIGVNENLTAGRAILRAGGFADFANKKRVKVIRSRAGGARSSFELNMVDILEEGQTEKDVVLEPDDSVIVPSRLLNF